MAKARPQKLSDDIYLVVCTSLGQLLEVKITSGVLDALKNSKAIPTYFMGGLKIAKYILAPNLEKKLQGSYEEHRAKEIIMRLTSHLDGMVLQNNATIKDGQYEDSMMLD